jgi:predicted dehydrogenase
MVGQGAIRFGVLGAAGIVPKALIQPARHFPDAQVVAIAARDPARAREFMAVHGIPRVFPTYLELVNAPEVDAVYIALPNSMHCEWTIRALRSGKHVLCEKPFSCNAAEAVLMARVAGETGLVLSEGFHYLYHPLASRIRNLIRDGELGELLRVEAEFSAPISPPNIRYDLQLGGGATMDLGCYGLNMIRHFSGSTPEVRRAVAVIGPHQIDRAMSVELNLPVGASALMRCSMAHDARVSIYFCCPRRPRRTSRH